MVKAYEVLSLALQEQFLRSYFIWVVRVLIIDHSTLRLGVSPQHKVELLFEKSTRYQSNAVGDQWRSSNHHEERKNSSVFDYRAFFQHAYWFPDLQMLKELAIDEELQHALESTRVFPDCIAAHHALLCHVRGHFSEWPARVFRHADTEGSELWIVVRYSFNRFVKSDC